MCEARLPQGLWTMPTFPPSLRPQLPDAQCMLSTATLSESSKTQGESLAASALLRPWARISLQSVLQNILEIFSSPEYTKALSLSDLRNGFSSGKQEKYLRHRLGGLNEIRYQ